MAPARDPLIIPPSDPIRVRKTETEERTHVSEPRELDFMEIAAFLAA